MPEKYKGRSTELRRSHGDEAATPPPPARPPPALPAPPAAPLRRPPPRRPPLHLSAPPVTLATAAAARGRGLRARPGPASALPARGARSSAPAPTRPRSGGAQPQAPREPTQEASPPHGRPGPERREQGRKHRGGGGGCWRALGGRTVSPEPPPAPPDLPAPRKPPQTSLPVLLGRKESLEEVPRPARLDEKGSRKKSPLWPEGRCWGNRKVRAEGALGWRDGPERDSPSGAGVMLSRQPPPQVHRNKQNNKLHTAPWWDDSPPLPEDFDRAGPSAHFVCWCDVQALTPNVTISAEPVLGEVIQGYMSSSGLWS
ncbi:formin-like protein 5 [Ursus maritimus]|uniref:Formin-like protein 5 n=1 Tax=Ursus maritimus TaxID=29073 RepID=A0A8M1G487_URSMA|nr:formin-like protein 5 [Ursus maritimus]